MTSKKTDTHHQKCRHSIFKDSRYAHWKLLLFWPIFGMLFFMLERLFIRETYYPVSCELDNYIPFCEYFLIPYLFWFVFLVGIHVYTFFYEADAFRKLMKFIIISFSVSVLIYLVFPNCQQLRPEEFVRDNIFTRFMEKFYRFDTNTNVSPSLHVIGSVAVLACAWNSRRFRTMPWRTAFTVTTILISISTVFLKQHSVVDILTALPVCALAYYFTYVAKRPAGGFSRKHTKTNEMYLEQ